VGAATGIRVRGGLHSLSGARNRPLGTNSRSAVINAAARAGNDQPLSSFIVAKVASSSFLLAILDGDPVVHCLA
jgi:hypothetical protein